MDRYVYRPVNKQREKDIEDREDRNNTQASIPTYCLIRGFHLLTLGTRMLSMVVPLLLLLLLLSLLLPFLLWLLLPFLLLPFLLRLLLRLLHLPLPWLLLLLLLLSLPQLLMQLLSKLVLQVLLELLLLLRVDHLGLAGLDLPHRVGRHALVEADVPVLRVLDHERPVGQDVVAIVRRDHLVAVGVRGG